jgi:hypothetical protein
VYQGVETRLRQVEKRLHDNINLASWDLLRKSRPSWDPSVSAATLINQVLIKIIHLKLNLRMQLLVRCFGSMLSHKCALIFPFRRIELERERTSLLHHFREFENFWE